ncbi:glutamine amidotransferase-related protein [Streptococcus sp. DD12]|uniref:glutamine amidotransferase-related protein n=1 Tax=Streptococcus sp. DD12 TaxID=1777880 RepID=UPI000792F131|nr:gamma-glutamyl-gamma-aminobutyrate hydrolase family protein [Streptococcus sp. DD12]KXT76952.1 Glutamine amidotransferase, class I [Streptococcus sp. DD12]
MKIQFVVHESFEAPVAYLKWAQARGHDVQLIEVYKGDKLPQDASAGDMLVVMGGPQSPQTTRQECPHFDADAEKALIQAYMAADKPIVGVCLGAQLLGEAYGAPVEHSPEREIGVFPIQLTKAGQADPCLQDFAETELVGHWHGDMPGLTPEAVVLATSSGCPRQLVRFGDKHYAFQCHLEFDQAAVQGLLVHEEAFDQQVAQNTYVQDQESLLSYDYQDMNALLWTFLDRLVV